MCVQGLYIYRVLWAERPKDLKTFGGRSQSDLIARPQIIVGAQTGPRRSTTVTNRCNYHHP